MDGTIVDSTAIVERAWGWWAQRHEIALHHVLHFSHGRPTAATMQHFLPGIDHSAELDEMKAWEEEAREGIVAVPGAIDAVREASKGPWAVVTSAPRRLAEIRIAVTGFPRPKILVAVEDIERGKPDPEGFLKAANELGIPPAECLVFEDTGPGVEAGVRAGMQVVGLLTTVPREQLSTRLVIRDFRDVAISWRLGGFDVSIVSA